MGVIENQAIFRAVPAEAARVALERAVASPEFRTSARMRQLLTFVVEQTIQGRGSELKETVIGTEVFGRDPGYDPKSDPVARKEAARLRTKLEEYYRGSGSLEPVRIEIPKGGYVAVFSEKAQPAAVVAVAQGGTSAPDRRVRLIWAVAIATVGVLLLGVIIAHPWATNRPPLVPRYLTGNTGSERSPAFSPDGQEVAFAWASPRDRWQAIYIQSRRTDSLRRLTSSADYEDYPAWSSDGERIAFVRRAVNDRYSLCVRSRDGSERILAEIAQPGHVAWSPDGALIAVSDSLPASPPAIFLVSTQNGGRRQVTTPGPGLGDTYPAFSRDGERLAFLRAVIADVAEVYVLDLKSAAPPQRLTSENRKIEGFAWWDEDSLVVSLARGGTARSLWRVHMRGGPLERIAAAGTGVFFPAWSARTAELAFMQMRNEIHLWRVPADGSAAPVEVAASRNLNSSPSVSPNGTGVAFRSTRSGTNEIWITGLFEDAPRRVTHINGALTGSPSWSPDGHLIAFDSRANGDSEIMVVPATGGAWRAITNERSNDVLPRWSRDGQWIYFASDRSGMWQVWKQRVSGGPAEQVTWRGGYAAAESPDGRYLYYVRGPNAYGLYRVAKSGGEEEEVLDGFAGKLWGNWVPAPGGIYYLDYSDANPSADCTIRFLDMATRQSRAVCRMPHHPVLWDGGMALSPDGKWVVFAELDYSGSNIQLLGPYR